ncbi:MAG: hypothetical protein A2167_08035 [Planctomycetes bacterium RBG_13_46_10]|nr:MAG: hypothetical protein A2167_08035 [Planctomycetes bacterium RBG_13_46_10]
MAKNDKMKVDEKEQSAQQQVQSGPPPQQRQVRFVEEGVKTQYSGVFNIGFGAEEVVFIFGNPSLNPNVVRIESKVAVSLKTAKRIAVTLTNMLRRHEAIHGEIDISAPKTVNDDKERIQ